MRTPIQLLIAFVAGAAALPAHAQIYKWVDERGVTNYSSQPPADPKAVRKLGLVENRLSVYTPDHALVQAIEALHQRNNQALSERVDLLERQLEAERRARELVAAAATQPALCPGGLDCYGISSGYYPYGFGLPYVPARFRHRGILQTHLTPGTIAGNVVGMNGYIPGNSAAAPAQSGFSSRRFRAAPSHRGLPDR